VGDSGVGKSCLLDKLLDVSSTNAFISTIGVDIKTHAIHVDGKSVKLQVVKVAKCDRVARCSAVQTYQNGKNMPADASLPIDHKQYQIAIKYTKGL
jgi:GTPase SAR1 family protein